MIVFVCLSCRKRIKLKPELAGKKGKCPFCKHPVTVPRFPQILSEIPCRT